MFDKLEDLLVRFEEVLNELGEPGVTDNQERFQKLMKEQSELQPIVDWDTISSADVRGDRAVIADQCCNRNSSGQTRSLL